MPILLVSHLLRLVAIRNYWRKEVGLPRSQIEAIPFWKAGVAKEIYHEERHHVMDEEV